MHCWCAGAAILCAGLAEGQQAPKLPAATGVANTKLHHAMSALKPQATFAVGGQPDWMALTDEAVWVTSSKTNQVLRLDTKTNQVAGSVSVAKPCSGLVAAFGSLWVPSCGDQTLVRLDLKTAKVIATIAAGPADSEGGIAAGAGSVWMVSAVKGELVRVSPESNTVVATISIAARSYAPAFAQGAVWITSTGGNLLTRVDAATNKVVSTTPVGKQPRFLTVGAGSVWTLNQGDGTISRVDATTGKLLATINAGLSGEGGEIAFGEGAVWATLFRFPITRIDPATNAVTGQWTGKGGDSIRAGLGSVWLTDLLGGVVWRLDPSAL